MEAYGGRKMSVPRLPPGRADRCTNQIEWEIKMSVMDWFSARVFKLVHGHNLEFVGAFEQTAECETADTTETVDGDADCHVIAPGR